MTRERYVCFDREENEKEEEEDVDDDDEDEDEVCSCRLPKTQLCICEPSNCMPSNRHMLLCRRMRTICSIARVSACSHRHIPWPPLLVASIWLT